MDEADIADTAIRIAKIWGCLCHPRVVRHSSQGFLLKITLKHTDNCPYRPISFFEAPEEIDEEALAKSAVAIKKARTKITRAANKKAKT